MSSSLSSCENPQESHSDSSDYDEASAEKFLAQLKPCAAQITAIARNLEARFADGHRLPNGINGATIHDVIIRMRAITNREYRNLVGLLNFVRDDGSAVALEQALGKIIESGLASSEFREICILLKSIRDQGFEYHTGRSPLFSAKSAGLELANPAFNWDREFADRTLRLVRILYPLGINMLNPSWSAKIENGISASEVVKVALPGGRDHARIEILPFGSSSRIVHAAKDGAKREFAPVELHEGSAVLIGRELSIHDLYGHSFVGESIEVPVAAKVSGRQVSRGGLLVIRKDGFIYLFDRGSLHDVTFSFQGNQWNRYQSDSRMVSSGFEHGKSTLCEEKDGSA